MTITPDTKDWTWVLEKPCPDCGFVAGDVDPRTVPDAVRTNAEAWQQVLKRQRYDEQDPAQVATELEDAARTVADRFAGLDPDQWQRKGRRSDGASFTVDSFSRYFLHDVVHHLHDVRG